MGLVCFSRTPAFQLGTRTPSWADPGPQRNPTRGGFHQRAWARKGERGPGSPGLERLAAGKAQDDGHSPYLN